MAFADLLAAHLLQLRSVARTPELVLVDGSSYVYRAFHALVGSWHNSKVYGRKMNAQRDYRNSSKPERKAASGQRVLVRGAAGAYDE